MTPDPYVPLKRVGPPVRAKEDLGGSVQGGRRLTDRYRARHLVIRGGQRGGNGGTKAERSLPNRCRERRLRGQRAALAGEGWYSGRTPQGPQGAAHSQAVPTTASSGGGARANATSRQDAVAGRPSGNTTRGLVTSRCRSRNRRQSRRTRSPGCQRRNGARSFDSCNQGWPPCPLPFPRKTPASTRCPPFPAAVLDRNGVGRSTIRENH
jgi:hypothetical protein